MEIHILVLNVQYFTSMWLIFSIQSFWKPHAKFSSERESKTYKQNGGTKRVWKLLSILKNKGRTYDVGYPIVLFPCLGALGVELPQ